jgi:hypothetical protein
MPTSGPEVSRTFYWYIKFVLAVYAAGFAAAMLLVLAAMPFVGLRAALFERWHGVEPFAVAMFMFGIAFSHIIWRRLR